MALKDISLNQDNSTRLCRVINYNKVNVAMQNNVDCLDTADPSDS